MACERGVGKRDEVWENLILLTLFCSLINKKFIFFTQVAERFVAAIDESIKPPLQMGFFIHYNVDDILRQATESTLRYQRGTL